jgi:hypothetical protein
LNPGLLPPQTQAEKWNWASVAGQAAFLVHSDTWLTAFEPHQVEERPGGVLVIHDKERELAYAFELPITVQDVHGKSLSELRAEQAT